MNIRFHSLAVANLVKAKVLLEDGLCIFNKWLDQHSDKIMFVGGIVLIASAYPSLAVAQGDIDPGPIDRVIQILLGDLIEGSFGALVMVVAGLVAIISASMGAYRASMSALVVAVGAFVLRSFVTAFWPQVEVGQ